MRNAVINTVLEFAKKDKKIFLVAGDAGFGVLDQFKRLFPERFLNLGVAEQNMISFSSGLALAGFCVFVYDIIPFLLYRPYEQIRNDICYQRLPVKLIGIGSGITYAPQGITHYAVEDIIIARSLPNLIILSPADSFEAKKCVEFSLKSKYPVYIRVSKNIKENIHKEFPETIEEPILIKDGKKIAVLFYGSISEEIIKVIKNLNLDVKFISIPMIWPLNFKKLLSLLKNINIIITVEEHFKEGGLGSIISEFLLKNNIRKRLIKLGIENEFIHSVNNIEGLRKKYGISSQDIIKVIKEFYG